jgi:hypothetical protein
MEHTGWPGMIHGFAALAGVIDAAKMLIIKLERRSREMTNIMDIFDNDLFSGNYCPSHASARLFERA